MNERVQRLPDAPVMYVIWMACALVMSTGILWACVALAFLLRGIVGAILAALEATFPDGIDSVPGDTLLGGAIVAVLAVPLTYIVLGTGILSALLLQVMAGGVWVVDAAKTWGQRGPALLVVLALVLVFAGQAAFLHWPVMWALSVSDGTGVLEEVLAFCAGLRPWSSDPHWWSIAVLAACSIFGVVSAAGSASIESGDDGPRGPAGAVRSQSDQGLEAASNPSSASRASRSPYTRSEKAPQCSVRERQTSQPRPALDLNLASNEQLAALPGIGPKLAERIRQKRERDGPFRSLQDLRRVKGVGAAKLERLRGLVCVAQRA